MPIIRLQKYNKIIPFEPVLHWREIVRRRRLCAQAFCVIVLRLGSMRKWFGCNSVFLIGDEFVKCYVFVLVVDLLHIAV